jgi:hypothetical protein
MPNIIFTSGVNTFTFSHGRSYPLDDPAQVSVVTDLAEGKQMYAYNKGVQISLFNLYFEKLDQTDFDNFENWLTDVAVGPKNTFVYTDEDGTDHTVRLLNTTNPLKEISHNNFAGTIQLRKEIT